MFGNYNGVCDSNIANTLEKLDKLEQDYEEEINKPDDERDKNREFELMYARLIAGFKINTGGRLF